MNRRTFLTTLSAAVGLLFLPFSRKRGRYIRAEWYRPPEISS